MLMPLVLDDFAEPEGDSHAEAYARQCGLLRDKGDRPFYTVMVSILLGEDGTNRTPPAFVASVDRLAAKYMRSVSFFASGKVITAVSYTHLALRLLPRAGCLRAERGPRPHPAQRGEKNRRGNSTDDGAAHV